MDGGTIEREVKNSLYDNIDTRNSQSCCITRVDNFGCVVCWLSKLLLHTFFAGMQFVYFFFLFIFHFFSFLFFSFLFFSFSSLILTS